MNFPDAQVKAYEAQSLHGDHARRVRDGADWKWLQEFIFGALEDEAIQTLRNAKCDEDRVKAQQMFLACEKPRRLIESLISQGDAAYASLTEISQSQLQEQQEQQEEPNGSPTLNHQEEDHA